MFVKFFGKINFQYLNESNQSVEHKGAVTRTEVIIMPHPSSLTVLEHFVNGEDEVKLHKKLKLNFIVFNHFAT